MSASGLKTLVVALLCFALASPVSAKDDDHALAPGNFVSLGTFDVMAGNGSTVAEIVDVSTNGKQLVYTDSENGEIGFVDIRNPRRPQGEGTVAVGGSPTSLVMLDPLVLVGVNTSESFTSPSGRLVVVNRNTRRIIAELELGGQPDSLALAPDRKRLAIVLENERDEDFNDGLLPQAPSGALAIVDLAGAAKNWSVRFADLSPVAAHATDGGDLEPEFVDINSRNEAVVTFQENNHIAIVDMVSGRTLNDFPAGSVALSNVDIDEEDLINLDSDITRRREPDAVVWIDENRFATANEGDYEDSLGEAGGSRSFTIFSKSGAVEFESAESFEHALVAAGHYNEARSEIKGVEPESVEVGTFLKRKLLFVGSERSNVVGVYDLSSGVPELAQLLPTGIGPEGLRAIPQRGLFVASTETDEAGIGIPTMVNIYGLRERPARYPSIVSETDADGLPIPWVALSGLAGDPFDADRLYAVSDSFLADAFVYTVDVSSFPAKIIDRIAVSGASSGLDLEGIAVGADGAFWLGSEGNAGSLPNLVLKVDPWTGQVIEEFTLPADLVDGRRGNGIEGIAVVGAPGEEIVYVAIQRAWPNEGDIDGVNTKIGRYEVATGEWTFVHYPLEPIGGGDWIGLSELTLLPDGNFAVIERDKGWGPSTGFVAELKSLFRIDLANAEFRPYGDPAGLVSIEKTLLADLLPRLARRSIWTPEKLEGFAVSASGRAFAVTDNDGVDGATGETLFLRLGSYNRLEREAR